MKICFAVLLFYYPVFTLFEQNLTGRFSVFAFGFITCVFLKKFKNIILKNIFTHEKYTVVR